MTLGEKAALKAANHIIDRIHYEPNLSWVMAGTQGLRLLVEAKAKIDGSDVDAIDDDLMFGERPHWKYEPELPFLRKQIEDIERLCRESPKVESAAILAVCSRRNVRRPKPGVNEVTTENEGY